MSSLVENHLRKLAASRKRRPYIIGAVALAVIIGLLIVLVRHAGA